MAVTGATVIATSPQVKRSRLTLYATETQLQVLRSPARFKVVFAGRRWGKTTCGVLSIIEKVSKAAPYEGGLGWWISPTYRQSRRPFRQLVRGLRDAGLLHQAHRGDLSITTNTGWQIEFRSADRPDNLLGEGLNFVVIDEHAILSDELWYECVRPMLADTCGTLLGIGTPRGKRGWAFQLWARAKQKAEKDYAGFHYTVNDSVFIPASEAREAQRTMPDRAFRQEFMAEFLDSTGAVFAGVRQRVAIPVLGEAVGIGVDWAKKVDYTSMHVVGARSGCVMEVIRAPRVAYTAQVGILEELIQKWAKRTDVTPCVVHDQTGVGEAVSDLLAAARIKAEGIIFTEAVKRELIEEAIVAFESNQLGWLPDQPWTETVETSVLEHELFTVTLNASNRPSYSAPEGAHDDCVMSLALANRARRSLWKASLRQPRVTIV